MLFLIIVILLCIYVGHKIHLIYVKALNECAKRMTFDQIDNGLLAIIGTYNDSTHKYNYIYDVDNMPLGRASAFLNFFGKSIYNEEPYLFLCKRSSIDNEFREYGCMFARTGVYFSKQAISSDRKSKNGSIDKYISYYGLVKVLYFNSKIVTINVRTDKFFDKIQIIDIDDAQIAQKIKNACDYIIKNDIGYCLYKDNVASVIDNSESNSTYSNSSENEDTFDWDYGESGNKYNADEQIRNAENKLASRGIQKGVQVAGVQAVAPEFAASYGEVKHLMDGARGHGYAAEYGNNTFDRMLGRDVESVAQDLDAHGRQVKHGADRLVNGIEIQTKYYKTASETIGAAFQKKEAIYMRSDGSGKMMQIEVPRDQYREALQAMQKRIDSGQVPNVAPGESAKDYVRKGFFTYEQSFNIARAGTIESLSVDAVAGAVCCLGAAGISSVIIFAQAIWRGASPKEAMRECLQTSLVIMGKGTLIYTLTMQLSRKEVANVLAGKVFTADGISQGYAAFTNPVYTFSENMATRIGSSSLATSQLGQKIGIDQITGRQLIGGTVTAVVVFGPDLVRSLQGKISMKQLAKNTAIGVSGMVGASVGQALIPIPVVGAVIGGAVAGTMSKKALDRIIEDDAKELFRILKEEFIDQTMLANLTKEEFDKVTELTVKNKKLSKKLQDMYKSKEYRAYARDSIMIPAIIEVTKARTKVMRDDYDKAFTDVALVI